MVERKSCSRPFRGRTAKQEPCLEAFFWKYVCLGPPLSGEVETGWFALFLANTNLFRWTGTTSHTATPTTAALEGYKAFFFAVWCSPVEASHPTPSAVRRLTGLCICPPPASGTPRQITHDAWLSAHVSPSPRLFKCFPCSLSRQQSGPGENCAGSGCQVFLHLFFFSDRVAGGLEYV